MEGVTGSSSEAITDGMFVLGIDAGGSSTRWRVIGRDGRPHGQGRLGPLSGLLYDAASRAAAAPVLDQIATAVLEVGRPARVAAGVTGLSNEDETARWIAEELGRRLGLLPHRLIVLNDMEVAYRASFAPGKGVLVYGGTGSVGFHVSRTGAAVRAGGHGYLIGDDGGGFSIGRAALRRVLQETDRLGAPLRSVLAEGVYQVVGGDDWPTIRRYVYGGGRTAVAALAPAVGRAARDGDVDALTLLDRAGRELAQLAEVLMARLDASLPVVLAGGVTHLGAPLTDAFRLVLEPVTEVSVDASEPVEAAARLALVG